MEPTPEQVEAVARAIERVRDEAYARNCAPGDDDYARAAIAAMNAEPLTSTPEPSTTEIEAEGPITLYRVDRTGESFAERQMPGFSWEYRAVYRDCSCGSWLYEMPRPQLGEVVAFIERRLVGPAERVQE